MLAIAHKGSDGYDLYKTRGRSFDRGESVTLFEYAMGFDRIVGNPAIGPFAAQYSTNRRVFFITLTKDFKKTKAQVDDVHDVSQKGVLGRMIVKENDLADPDLGPIGCWDVRSGRKQWQLSENNHERAQWLDHYALVGQELRNPKTGQVVHKTPDFRTFIAARGKTIWLITNGLNRQLEVWRVPG
jgi:hypothetical protein